MTDELKCPCGKRHQDGPRGATSITSEALNEQVRLYASLNPVMERRPDDFPFRPMVWQVTEDPPTIRALEDGAVVMHMTDGTPVHFAPSGDNHGTAGPVWDPLAYVRQRQDARLAADRAMARARQRG